MSCDSYSTREVSDKIGPRKHTYLFDLDTRDADESLDFYTVDATNSGGFRHVCEISSRLTDPHLPLAGNWTRFIKLVCTARKRFDLVNRGQQSFVQSRRICLFSCL